MPAPVEIRDPARRVGVYKVLYKAEAQHQADAARHQGISPEIKIELERIAHRPQPCQRGGNTLKADLDNFIPQNSEPVGDQNLHSKTDDKKAQTVLDFLKRDCPLHVHRPPPYIGRFFDPSLGEAHDRPLRDLRKHRKICRSLHKGRSFVHLFEVKICLIGNHFEDIKAQSQGKERGLHFQSEDLEYYENDRIDHDDRNQHLTLLCLSPSPRHHPDQFTEQIIYQNKPQEEQGKPFGA